MSRPNFPAVSIVLSTYNGGPFIAEQIESIRQQTFRWWRLLVRDDGSTDQTVPILHRLAAKDPRIEVLTDPERRLGAKASFGWLMDQAYRRGAEYLLFSDQDDHWHPEKIEILLDLMFKAEGPLATREPLLVYSDLEVMDTLARRVHPSLFRYARLYRPNQSPWRTLLGRSFVLGCAALINRPLMEFAIPVPQTAVMHDWWVALCAAFVGRLVYCNRPLVRYRRHGQNSSGPAGFWSGFNPRAYSWKKRWEAGRWNFVQSLAQALTLRDRLAERGVQLPRSLRQSLDRFCEVLDLPRPNLRGIYRLGSLGVPELDPVRRVLYYLCLLVPDRTPVL